MGCVLFISIVQFSRIKSAFSAVEDYFIKSSFCCQALFSIFSNFFLLLVWFVTSENYYITFDSACQCFSFKTFAVNLHNILFAFRIFRSDSYLLYSLSNKCQHLLSTFFIFLKDTYSFLYINKKTGFSADLSFLSLITALSFLLRFQPVFFLPFWKHTEYMQHHL